MSHVLSRTNVFLEIFFSKELPLASLEGEAGAAQWSVVCMSRADKCTDTSDFSFDWQVLKTS